MRLDLFRRFVRDPNIEIKCDCGATVKLAFGESGSCGCGRTYTTVGISEKQYRRTADIVRKYRIIRFSVIGGGAFVIFLIVLQVPMLLMILGPLAFGVWFILVRRLLHNSFVSALGKPVTWDIQPQTTPQEPTS